MNRNNEPTVVGNSLPTPAQRLQWLSDEIARRVSSLPPSSAVTLRFVDRVLDCSDAKKLKRLAILAGLKTIVDHAGGTSSLVLQSGRPHAREQVEWANADRGRTQYVFVPEVIETATIDAVLPPFADESDLSHLVLITTETTDPAVHKYASGMYRRTWGTEFAILDCPGFVRHFLHLFHRHRVAFLAAYQDLVLSEPESAVNFAGKQLFLSLFLSETAPPPDADA